MNIKIKYAAAISTLISYGAIQTSAAFAWNNLGHMAVAAVAYDKLKPQTKARVMDLLKMNPLYDEWNNRASSKLSQNSRNRIVFMNAATWPDTIKDDHANYHPDGNDDGETPVEPVASQNSGYDDHNLHKYWHYDDSFFSTDGTQLPNEQKPNAQTQIELFREVLSSDKSDQLKSYDLTWLLHLIGDVHQPLHTASRASSEHSTGDRGGNSVKLVTGKSLHSYWDAAAGVGSTKDALTYAQGLDLADETKAADLNDEHWLQESLELAKSVAYGPNLKELPNGKFRLINDYDDQAENVARQQIELAGERLANLLNKELK